MEAQNNNDILLIEDYLDGKLSDSEREAFEKRLENDSELAKLYRFRMQLRSDWKKVKEYQSANQQVANVIQQSKKNTRRKIIYAVAASIAVMIVIAGALTIDFGGEQEQMAETNVDSAKTQTFEPQIKQPESYADSGKYMEEQLTLSHEIKNDSVILSWQPVFKTETTIIILSRKTGKEVFRKLILSESESLTLHQNNLPSGGIIWFPEGFAKRDTILK